MVMVVKSGSWGVVCSKPEQVRGWRFPWFEVVYGGVFEFRRCEAETNGV